MRDSPETETFERLVAGPCPPPGDLLLALAALTGLYARFVRDGDEGRARRAGLMRARLPVARH